MLIKTISIGENVVEAVCVDGGWVWPPPLAEKVRAAQEERRREFEKRLRRWLKKNHALESKPQPKRWQLDLSALSDLRQAVRRAGGQKRMAAKVGMSVSMFQATVRGERLPSEKERRKLIREFGELAERCWQPDMNQKGG